ncbi:helix-turn-helix domain-containing protein [Rhizobium sp. RAF56]|uniref:helix-turn-helix domain-containing protein n=1 Tax=Rhizobium sp. RAF56 TaxID=3233062 RepID=UPI003F96C1AF
MIASSLVKPLTFDTSNLPREQQFEAWRAYNASLIDVSLSRETRGSFSFEQKVWDFGKLAFSTSRLPGPSTPRSWEHIRKDPIDHWCLVLPENAAHLAKANKEAPQVYFRNLGRPYAGSAADSSVATLFIPRDMLRPIAGALDAHDGTLGQDGLGALFADFLISLERRLPTITSDEMPRLAEAVCAMITACIAPSKDNLADARSPIADTLLERARQRIQQNLYSPRLTPTSLSGELGISRTTLYSLFEPLQGVSRYIQRQRLIAAHKMLSDPDNRISMQQLSDLLCFADTGGFSRAFRQTMGCSPREVRAAGIRKEFLPVPPAPVSALERLTDIGDVLRRLQA